MQVELLCHSPIRVAEIAGRICVGNRPESDLPNLKYIAGLIKAGHESVIEHVVYTFQITGLSRACLQQLARHRHVSLSVKSTRWCLGKHVKYYVPEELDGEAKEEFSYAVEVALEFVQDLAKRYGNDVAKYLLPEAVLTDLILTTNMRELRHIYRLRTDKRAMKEFRDLCHAVADTLPKEHRMMLTLPTDEESLAVDEGKEGTE